MTKEVPHAPSVDLTLNILSIKRGTLILRAITHPLRQKMLRLLHRSGSMTVTLLYQQLSLEQSVASQHLAILRRAGIVQAEKKAKFVFYSVHYQRLHQLTVHTHFLLKEKAR